MLATQVASEDLSSAPALEAYLRHHEARELLRLVAVGSVDDGKSTLVGRLLYDTGSVFDDQLEAIRRASENGEDFDYSLLTDGLRAEREQGITIDVAYRYFSTPNRKFILADTPGHIQYTRNMATGASTADVAVILVDARLGVLPQSRRHAMIASLLGIKHLIVAINKLDLVDFSESVFNHWRAAFMPYLQGLNFATLHVIPVSALRGDNIASNSARTPWYAGPSLLALLESLPIFQDRNLDDFRFPVQLVLRPNLDFRGFAGQIASGRVRRGEEVIALPSGRRSRVRAISTPESEDAAEAFAPMSVVIRLNDELDLSRGEMLVTGPLLPSVLQRFSATLVWLNEQPMDLSRSYWIKHTSRTSRASLQRVHHRINLETLQHEPATHLELNDIGKVSLLSHQPLFLDDYPRNRATGAFVLIDALSNNTVAAGMVHLEGNLPPEGSENVESSTASIPTASIPIPLAAGPTAQVLSRLGLRNRRGLCVRIPNLDLVQQTELLMGLASRGVLAVFAPHGLPRAPAWPHPDLSLCAGLVVLLQDDDLDQESLTLELPRASTEVMSPREWADALDAALVKAAAIAPH